jgi:hypothetical protein
MAFALGGSVVSILPPNQSAHTEQADCAPNGVCGKHEVAKSFRERLSIIWSRTWDDPVAFYTFVLGIFTAVLAVVAIAQIRFLIRADRTARIAALAADRSARTAELSLMSLEIPYLYPIVRRHGLKVGTSKKTGQPAVVGFEFGNEFVTFGFKNFGRTPADIIEVYPVIRFGMGLPPLFGVPELPFNRLSGIIVGDREESEDFHCALNEAQYMTVYRGAFDPDLHIVWLLGYVRYRDVFENEYVHGFTLGFAPNMNTFYSMGGEGYNYRKKTKAAGQSI